MRSHLLTSVAMLMALLATTPVNAEEEASQPQVEAMDAGMAEAAAEQESMEAEAAASQEMTEETLESQVTESATETTTETMEDKEIVEPQAIASSAKTPADSIAESMDAGMAEAEAEQEPMEAEAAASQEVTEETVESQVVEVETSVEEEVTGTVMEMSGPAALPQQEMNVPTRGMHMKQVERIYGKPIGINPPVGDPPITRWDYPGYSVYFEYSYVIQSVGN